MIKVVLDTSIIEKVSYFQENLYQKIFTIEKLKLTKNAGN